MPNHITNVLKGPQELYDYIRGEGDQIVDLNKVIPMPDIVSNESTDSRLEMIAKNRVGAPNSEVPMLAAMQAANRAKVSEEGLSEEDIAIVEQMVEAYKQTGCFTWYDWHIKYWGTKWNAYDHYDTGDGLSFDTAWNTPIGVWEELAKKFDFEVLYVDEDSGHNLGQVKVKDGKLDVWQPEPGSVEAYAFYAYVKDDDLSFLIDYPEDEEDGGAANKKLYDEAQMYLATKPFTSVEDWTK